MAPDEPATPRPAATVILLRRGGKHADRGLEVLLAQRNPEARFMPGVWVFPGRRGRRRRLGRGRRRADADESAHRACAVRELAEEVGIELRARRASSPGRAGSRPSMVPIRFDTLLLPRARARRTRRPSPTAAETVDARWFEPQAALDAPRAGRARARLPDDQAPRVAAALRTAAEAALAAVDRPDRRADPAARRRRGRDPQILLPGEPGFDDATRASEAREC